MHPFPTYIYEKKLINYKIFNPATAKISVDMFQLAKAHATEAIKCPCHEGITCFPYFNIFERIFNSSDEITGHFQDPHKCYKNSINF